MVFGLKQTCLEQRADLGADPSPEGPAEPSGLQGWGDARGHVLAAPRARDFLETT